MFKMWNSYGSINYTRAVPLENRSSDFRQVHPLFPKN